jgi:metal-dependent amidase/aminoacylase/carboxypeptidase family protein
VLEKTVKGCAKTYDCSAEVQYDDDSLPAVANDQELAGQIQSFINGMPGSQGATNCCPVVGTSPDRFGLYQNKTKGAMILLCSETEAPDIKLLSQLLMVYA